MQVSINGWMEKQNVVDTNDRVLFSLEKEGNSDTNYNVDASWRQCVKWNKPVTRRQIPHDSMYASHLQ